MFQVFPRWPIYVLMIALALIFARLIVISVRDQKTTFSVGINPVTLDTLQKYDYIY